jgi:uncharacterized membrane protein YccC
VGILTENLSLTDKVVTALNNKAGLIGTIVALAVILGLIIYAIPVQNWLLLAISVGALGGLVHEIAQSQGQYMTPHTDTSGNFVLGGLMGLVNGGIAGLLLMQSQPTTQNLVPFMIEVFLAGLALKGVNDAVNPPAKTP